MDKTTINTGAGRGHSPGRAPRGGWMGLGGRWSHALRGAGGGWAWLGWLWMAGWLAGTTALHAQTPAPQTVSWTAPASGTVLVLGQSYPLVATASSGLPVTFRVASGPGVVADGAITATGAGEIRVVAEQAGNDGFAPASLERGFNQRAVLAEGLGQWPGYPRGDAARVVLRGNRAFVSLGEAGLAIYDVSGGGTPVRLGGWDTPGTLEGIDVVGSVAYLADDVAGLHVVDVSNPAAPVRVGGFDTEGTAEGVRVVGNLAYVADGESGLLVLDVSNPSAPVRVGGLDTEGKANDVQVVGTVAYVADMGSGLQLVDVANPAEPKRLGGFDTDGTAYQVRVSGGMAYLADGYNGLVVLDVSDPAAVKSLGVLGTGGPAGGLEVSGDRVFVAAGYSGLVVVDVSKPAAPVAAGTFKTGGGGSDVALSGGLAYVADGYAGLRVLDVSNVGSIQSVGRLATTGYSYAVEVVGGLAYVADGWAGLQIFDVSNPANPARVGGLATPGNAVGVQVVGGIAYVAAYSSGLQIIDVSNPAAPVRLGGIAIGQPGFWNGAFAVQVVGGLAYVAAGEDGLVIVNVSNPAAPVVVGSYDTSGGWLRAASPGVGVQVVGNLAYLADGGAGLTILDVSNPASPTWVGHTFTRGAAITVQVDGRYAYVANGTGITVVDVSIPSFPDLLGYYEASPYGPFFGSKVQVVGSRAYVAGQLLNPGLTALDLSDLKAPLPIGGFGSFAQGGEALGLQVVGELAFVAAGKAGLQVVRLKEGNVQELSVDLPWTVPVDQPSIPLNPRSSAGLPVTVRVVSGPGVVKDNVLTWTGAGTIVVRVEQAGTDAYPPSVLVRSVEVSRLPQSITWATPAEGTLLRLGQAQPLNASASSGLPVGFRVVGGPAVIEGGSVRATGPGLVTLVAEQPGDATRAPAQVIRRWNFPTVTPEAVATWKGPWLGDATGLHVAGNRAYVTLGEAGLAVFDVTNPAEPKRLGLLDTDGMAQDVQVAGDVAYVADGGAGLHVIHVGNPAAPERMATLDTAGSATAVQVVGGIAYVADGPEGLQVIDVSNPAAPARIGGLDTEGEARSVQVVGNLAYVADGPSGFHVIDVSNPSAPVRVGGGKATDGSVLSVRVAANLAYVTVDAWPDTGLWVFDVSNASAPVRVSTWTEGMVSTVAIVDGIAWVTVPGVGLRAIDMSQPATPKTLGTVKTLGTPAGIQVVGDTAFVASGIAGLQAYDLRRPAEPVAVGGFATGGYVSGVRVLGNRAYVALASGLQILDISNPSEPVAMGAVRVSIPDMDPSYEALSPASRAVDVQGGIACVRHGLEVLIVDVSDSSDPRLLGRMTNAAPLPALSIQMVGQQAFVLTAGAAFWSGTLAAWDIADPAKPVMTAIANFGEGFSTNLNPDLWPQNVSAFQVTEGILYYITDDYSNWDLGLYVVDVRNPSSPRQIKFERFPVDVARGGLAIVDDSAYVGLWQGLRILNVSNPSQPLRRTPQELFGIGQVDALSVVSNTAYLRYRDGQDQSWVGILDVSNPGEPVVLARLPAEGSGVGNPPVVEGELSFQVLGKAGLGITRLRQGQAQSLSFALPEKVVLGGEPVALAGSASSGLPVTYAVVSGPGTVTGDRLALTGPGKVVVRATQGGDGQFLATSVERLVEAVLPPPPPVPPTLAAGAMAGPGRFRFEVTGGVGGKVAVQFSRDLQSWTTVSTQALPAVVEVPVAEGVDAGFYRALLTE